MCRKAADRLSGGRSAVTPLCLVWVLGLRVPAQKCAAGPSHNFPTGPGDGWVKTTEETRLGENYQKMQSWQVVWVVKHGRQDPPLELEGTCWSVQTVGGPFAPEEGLSAALFPWELCTCDNMLSRNHHKRNACYLQLWLLSTQGNRFLPAGNVLIVRRTKCCPCNLYHWSLKKQTKKTTHSFL